MRPVLGTVAAAVPLAAGSGARSWWVAPSDVEDSTPAPTAFSPALGSADNGGASSRFTADEVVSIVATVVADPALANGDGPAMDG